MGGNIPSLGKRTPIKCHKGSHAENVFLRRIRTITSCIILGRHFLMHLQNSFLDRFHTSNMLKSTSVKPLSIFVGTFIPGVGQLLFHYLLLRWLHTIYISRATFRARTIQSKRHIPGRHFLLHLQNSFLDRFHISNMLKSTSVKPLSVFVGNFFPVAGQLLLHYLLRLLHTMYISSETFRARTITSLV